LVIALRSVGDGKKFLSPDVSGHLVSFIPASRPGSAEGVAVGQTDCARAQHPEVDCEGRTNRSAAEFLNVSPKTVEKHRASLMRKLELRNAAELTLVALESGLIERPGT